jgi:hypothetical protein
MILKRLLTLGLVALACIGCNRAPVPPAPLAVELIPGELLKAYAKAAPDAKETVAVLNTSLQSKDYPTAFQAVQILFNAQEASKEQRSVVVRSMLTITVLLQNAQAQGDQKAATALAIQKRLK